MKYKAIFLITSLLAMAACSEVALKPPIAPEQLAADKGYQLGETVDRITNYRLDGWNYVSPRALIMHAGVTQKYLITLQTRCHELSSREVIGSTSTGTAMRAKYDAIIVQLDTASYGTGPSNTRKCYIDQIFKLVKQPKE